MTLAGVSYLRVIVHKYKRDTRVQSDEGTDTWKGPEAEGGREE